LKWGVYVGVKHRWKLTLADDRFGATAEVIEHEKLKFQQPEERGNRNGEPIRQASGQDKNAPETHIAFVRTNTWEYWGQDLSGRYFEDTLFDITPKDEATARYRMPTVVLYPPRDSRAAGPKCTWLWALGRFFSKELHEVTRVERSKDGLLVVSARGGNAVWRLNGRWELEIDPAAAWLVRKAQFRPDEDKIFPDHPGHIYTEMTNRGTVWSGPYCIPKEATVNCYAFHLPNKERMTFDPVVGKFDEKLYSKVQQAVAHNKEPALKLDDQRVSPPTWTEPNRPKPK
jgi:hypothetical protein